MHKEIFQIISLFLIAAFALALSACTEIESVLLSQPGSESRNEFAGKSAEFYRGFAEAHDWLSSFHETYSCHFGGDGSYHLFFVTFSIPLRWRDLAQPANLAGTAVTSEQLELCNSAAICLWTEFAHDTFTDYHYGAAEALKDF